MTASRPACAAPQRHAARTRRLVPTAAAPPPPRPHRHRRSYAPSCRLAMASISSRPALQHRGCRKLVSCQQRLCVGPWEPGRDNCGDGRLPYGGPAAPASYGSSSPASPLVVRAQQLPAVGVDCPHVVQRREKGLTQLLALRGARQRQLKQSRAPRSLQPGQQHRPCPRSSWRRRRCRPSSGATSAMDAHRAYPIHYSCSACTHLQRRHLLWRQLVLLQELAHQPAPQLAGLQRTLQPPRVLRAATGGWSGLEEGHPTPDTMRGMHCAQNSGAAVAVQQRQLAPPPSAGVSAHCACWHPPAVAPTRLRCWWPARRSWPRRPPTARPDQPGPRPAPALRRAGREHR